MKGPPILLYPVPGVQIVGTAQKNWVKLSNVFNSSYVKQCFYNIGESGAIFLNANDAEQQTYNNARFNKRLQIRNQRGGFTTETPVEQERRLEVQPEQRKRRRQQETS